MGLYVCMAIWLYGYKATWLYAKLYGHMATWLFGSTATYLDMNDAKIAYSKTSKI